MKLSLKGLSVACAIFWGGSLLLVGLVNLAVPGYGEPFLKLCDSLYPGFDNAHTFGSVIIGTLYGLVDGAIGGAIFGWIYNYTR